MGAASAVLLVAAACSVELATPPPGCAGGSGLIAAQSVPTAEQIPCFEDLPEGWSFATVNVNQNGTVVRLDSDRAGTTAATLRFEENCDLGAAVAVPSNVDEVERFDFIERLEPSFRAQTYYVFDGGCVTLEFDFDRGASATESVALDDIVAFVSRQDLNESIRESFIDEEL
ncbi:MAG: hypothetical protein OEU32_07595 [Acidimicrobiia bacterium]|nr:hypothetical protein [Acidimicrobiia bacterium]